VNGPSPVQSPEPPARTRDGGLWTLDPSGGIIKRS
jgi:hypothetical protein